MPVIILCVLELILLALLIAAVYSGRFMPRLIAKAAASLVFVLTAVTAYLQNGGDRKYYMLMLCGLVLSLIGDIFMQVCKLKDSNLKDTMFGGGILAFFAAHCFYSTAFIHLAGFSLIDIAITAIVMLIEIALLCGGLKLRYGKFTVPGMLYLAIISFMFAKGLSVLFTAGATTFSVVLLCGAVLFIVSDTLLTVRNFGATHKDSPHLSTAVFITYYLAQMLFAISIML